MVRNLPLFTRPQKTALGIAEAATNALDAKGVSYDVVDLTQDDSALNHVTELGYRQASVVVAGGDHWSGFRPDMIAQLA